MAKSTSQHILGTSANLLGFCLFVITSIHIRQASKTTLIDEFTSIIALLLIVSIIFSFLSIKTENTQKGDKLENIADIFFLLSVIGILFIVVFMVVKYSNI